MKNTYSVGQVNRYIKNMFTQDYLLQKIYVKGEVSNCKYHTSGHIYFSLKDETGTLNCVMFAGHRRGLAFAMKNGDKVIVGGSVDVYERDGRYQMYAKEITLEGAGALYERYLALKQELEDMGMFAQEYKQPIPRFLRRLGVVTAPTGAAVQDIRNISYRRNPYLQIILYPALVQGTGATESIVKGIERLDAADVDVIIVGRGGGSIEDLWAFNEEIVARAIFQCQTPIISAVGHETDFTIADFLTSCPCSGRTFRYADSTSHTLFLIAHNPVILHFQCIYRELIAAFYTGSAGYATVRIILRFCHSDDSKVMHSRLDTIICTACKSNFKMKIIRENSFLNPLCKSRCIIVSKRTDTISDTRADISCS